MAHTDENGRLIPTNYMNIRNELFNKVTDEITEYIWGGSVNLIDEIANEFWDNLYRNSDANEFSKLSNEDKEWIEQSIHKEIIQRITSK